MRLKELLGLMPHNERIVVQSNKSLPKDIYEGLNRNFFITSGNPILKFVYRSSNSVVIVVEDDGWGFDIKH